MTEDRSGLPKQLTKDLRRKNLAHLLAISGPHMRLLVSFVFWVFRQLVSVVPHDIIRLHAKKG